MIDVFFMVVFRHTCLRITKPKCFCCLNVATGGTRESCFVQRHSTSFSRKHSATGHSLCAKMTKMCEHLQTWYGRQGPVVVFVLVKGHVRCFMSLLHPLHRVAHIVLDEIVFPVDGKRCIAVNCHAGLPCSHTCEDKFRISFLV